MSELSRGAMGGIREYGLQTLKWAFLLNAGAIAIILAYVSGVVGKSQGAQLSTFAPVLKALWPFAIGCILVVFSGAAAFFNFSYAEAALPSAETLHNFLGPNSKPWPMAKFQQQDETLIDFYKRFSWKIGATRNIAITFALASGLFFLYGVYCVLGVVL
jgi:hypothetical protein